MKTNLKCVQRVHDWCLVSASLGCCSPQSTLEIRVRQIRHSYRPYPLQIIEAAAQCSKGEAAKRAAGATIKLELALCPPSSELNRPLRR